MIESLWSTFKDKHTVWIKCDPDKPWRTYATSTISYRHHLCMSSPLNLDTTQGILRFSQGKVIDRLASALPFRSSHGTFVAQKKQILRSTIFLRFLIWGQWRCSSSVFCKGEHGHMLFSLSGTVFRVFRWGGGASFCRGSRLCTLGLCSRLNMLQHQLDCSALHLPFSKLSLLCQTKLYVKLLRFLYNEKNNIGYDTKHASNANKSHRWRSTVFVYMSFICYLCQVVSLWTTEEHLHCDVPAER